MIFHISSPTLKQFHLTVEFLRSNHRPAPLPDDDIFREITLAPIHDTIALPLFDSLQSATIATNPLNDEKVYCKMADIILTEEEIAHQISMILQPWDERGILTVTGRHGRRFQTSQGLNRGIEGTTANGGVRETGGPPQRHMIMCTMHYEVDHRLQQL